MTKQNMLLDRSLGCMLGGAVGDALGAPVEFMDREAIVRRFGSGGIRDYAKAYGRLGAITDDTQMTLFTAEGCLRALARARTRGICDVTGVIRNAYWRWFATQDAGNASGGDDSGWLMQQNDLFSRRAPGNTCLSALSDAAGEQNNSKGCGDIMRVAPCGIIHQGVPREAFHLGCDAAKITHGHPTGYLSAGVFAAVISEVMAGRELLQALQTARTILKGCAGHAETLTALDAAVAKAQAGLIAETAIPELGEGWIAEEALAISVYCALTAKSFEQGIIAAVNITGDSDSTGSITGNLLGAIYGVAAIPDRWLVLLELQEVIETVAHDLILMPNTDLETDAEDYLCRYPPV